MYNEIYTIEDDIDRDNDSSKEDDNNDSNGD